MPIKVLVADDSPTIRRRAASTLTEAGYEVTCVESGEAAWALLESGDACHVLLCDILMPGMDGYELCRRVKTDARLSATPVLLLRGTFEPWDQAKAEAVGADGFITKPFDANVLLSTLAEVVAELGAAESAAPVVTPAAAPVPSPEETWAPSGRPDALAEDEHGPLEDITATGPIGEIPVAMFDEPMPSRAPVFDAPVVPGAVADAGDPADVLLPPELAPDAAPIAAELEPDEADASPFGEVQSSMAAPVALDDPFQLGEEPVVPAAPSAWPPMERPSAPIPAARATEEPPAEPVRVPAPPARPDVAAAPRAAVAPLDGEFDEAMLDRLVEKVIARISTSQVERIAWEVVPDVAEALIRRRIVEIEGRLAEE